MKKVLEKHEGKFPAVIVNSWRRAEKQIAAVPASQHNIQEHQGALTRPQAHSIMAGAVSHPTPIPYQYMVYCFPWLGNYDTYFKARSFILGALAGLNAIPSRFYFILSSKKNKKNWCIGKRKNCKSQVSDRDNKLASRIKSADFRKGNDSTQIWTWETLFKKEYWYASCNLTPTWKGNKQTGSLYPDVIWITLISFR